MAHFLLALVVLAGGVVVALEAWSSRAAAQPLVPRWLRLVGLALVAACAVLVVTGTFATASGPHPGDEADIERSGTCSTPSTSTSGATAVFGVASSSCSRTCSRRGRERRGLCAAALVLLGLLLVQMVVGEVQYRNELPWQLVLVHVALAAAIWAWTVGACARLLAPAAAARADGSRLGRWRAAPHRQPARAASDRC